MTTTTIDRFNGVNGGLAVKAPCRVATTANITLSGEQTIDGIAVVAGDRVLVKDQSVGADNGIYAVSTSAWSRTADFDGNNDIVTGTLVFVILGTTNAASFWRVTTSGTITVGTTSIAFALSSNQIAGVSAFMSTLLDDTSAATARATLGSTATGDAVFIAANAAAAQTAIGGSTVGKAVFVATDAAAGRTALDANQTTTSLTAVSPATGDYVSIADVSDSNNSKKALVSDILSLSSSSLTVSTTQATTSGTTKDFTSLPSGIKRIMIAFNGVSTNGTSNLLIQGMVSGSAVTSGYASSADYGGVGASSTAGFVIKVAAAADLYSGVYTLLHLGGNVWSGEGVVRPNNGTGTSSAAGNTTFAGTLNGIRITSATPDTFDAGSINIMYEV